MDLILIRHGQSKANANGKIQGWGNATLSYHGKNHANMALQQLKKRYVTLDKIYSSPLNRTYETALPISAAYRQWIRVRKDLAEWNIGKSDGMTLEEGISSLPVLLKQWLNQKDLHFPGGEGLQAFYKRVTKETDKIIRSGGKNIAIVTHSGVMSVIATYLLFGEPSIHWAFRWKYGEIVIFQVNRRTGRVQLIKG